MILQPRKWFHRVVHKSLCENLEKYRRDSCEWVGECLGKGKLGLDGGLTELRLLLSGEGRCMRGEGQVDRWSVQSTQPSRGRRCVSGKGTSFMKGMERG